MMSKQAPLQGSLFSIRFKPGSAAESKDEFGSADDVCDIIDRSLSHNGSCETVLIERLTDNDELASPHIDLADSKTPPSSLWKSPQTQLSRSAPVSELTSPVLPSTPGASEVMHEKSLVIKPLSGSQPFAEKLSIFSGLKEKLDKLSTESKEIFDRKMKRSGSADAAKITSLLADPGVTKSNIMKIESRGENADFVTKSADVEQIEELMSDVAEQSEDTDSPVSCLSHVHKSISSIEVMKADIVSASAAKLKRTSLDSEYREEPIVMSRLLSSTSQPGIEQEEPSIANASVVPRSLTSAIKETQQAAIIHRLGRSERLVPGTRIRYLLSFLVAIVAYVIFPMPAFISGMLLGAVLAASGIMLYQCLTRSRLATTVPCHDIRSAPTSIMADIRESKNMEGKFQGWMNELSHYNAAEFHINDTCSVYVTLESCTLRLQTPKHGIPKRAICDEYIPMAAFVRQRHFDLEGGRVYLLPRGLVSKRLWSKKYPICIVPRTVDVRLASDVVNVDGDQKRTVLYLFARTSRSKEQWYRRFVYASRGTPWPTRLSDVVAQGSPTADQSLASLPSVSWQKHHREGSTASTSSSVSGAESASEVEIDYSRLLPEHNLIDYSKYMSAVLPPGPIFSPSDDQSPASMTWLNALIGRLFLDFLREKYWAEKMRDKIQNKLCKMHVPHFINQLKVIGIELGCAVPTILHVSSPYLDDRGFWLDVDIAYSGGFCLSMETKCNLMRLKCASSLSASCLNEESTIKLERCGATCSDEEDSAESTTDEDNVEDNTCHDASTDERRSMPMGKKLLQFVDKISQSRYFQQATEYKYIKRAMEEVSNTRLVLNVELRSVSGTLAINIPPPPTDRFWYGFRSKPELVLFAKPWVGDHEVSLSPLTEWIEKKLAIEFQRVFVMPNMDDIPIPLMCAHLQQDDDPDDPTAT